MRFPEFTGLRQYVEREARSIGLEEDFEGYHGVVCRLIPGDKAIKIANLGKKKEIENELRVGQALFEAGISVPRHYGTTWAGIDFAFGIKLPVWGLVRDYVEGNTLSEVYEHGPTSAWEHANKLKVEELEKVNKLGFFAADTNTGNAIYTPDQRIVLIDFATWRMPK